MAQFQGLASPEQEWKLRGAGLPAQAPFHMGRFIQ